MFETRPLKFERIPLPFSGQLFAIQQSVSDLFQQNIPIAPTTPTEALIAFGRKKGWDCHNLGKAPLPESPIWVDKWLMIPAQLDTNPLPPRTMGRIQSLFAAGYRPKGFVLVHEAPKLLPTSIKSVTDNTPISLVSPEIKAKSQSAMKVIGGALGAIAVTTGTLILGLLAIGLVVPALLFAVAIVVDPILVVVMDDDSWVEIDRWWN